MSLRRSAALLATALTAALALAPAASADKAGSATASAGAVRATLSWSAGDFGARRPRLDVVRAGAQALVSLPVFAETCFEADCRFLPSGTRPSAVQVVDLDADGEPEVLVDAFTLGAHCCSLTELFGWTGGAYVARSLDWGNGGYDLRDLDGDRLPELVSADDRFSARYTAYALSARPLRILRYAGPGRALRAVTQRFPRAVRRDIRAQQRLLARARRDRVDDRRGVVAALVADFYSLGSSRLATAQLGRSRRAGDLGNAASATAFRSQLLRDLKRWRYR